MTRYLISFNDGAMDHIPAEEAADVANAAHAVVQEALNAGVCLLLADWKSSGQASSLPTERSPRARTRRARS